MFGVGAGEIIALIVLGLLLFGPEKLPEAARKLARVVQYLRKVANNAQDTIRSELGPGYEDFDIRDPKAFVRNHLLAEVEPMVADVRRELDEVREATDQLRAGGLAPVAGGIGEGAVAGPVPFDPEAT